MKVGDKVKVIDKSNPFYGKVGVIVSSEVWTLFPNVMIPVHKVNMGKTTHTFNIEVLKLVEEPKVYHLDLSLEDMNALAELGKMKDNLDLLERLLKRAKGEPND